MARILFIQNFWFEFLGTMVLSSVLKSHGHEVDLIIENDIQKIADYTEKYKPDIIGAYTVSGSHSWVSNAFTAAKDRFPALTIAGGPHPTFFPDFIREPGVDVVCIGEGEEALVELVESIEKGEKNTDIDNLWFHIDDRIIKNPLRTLIADLNTLPNPDRELYYAKYPILRESPSKHFITGRGCPFNCTFCSNKAYKDLYHGLGAMVRQPSPEKIVKEIKSIKETYTLKSVRFDDEVFLLNEEWLLEFLKRYKQEVDLPFSCLIRADLATPTMINAIRKAGCYIAYFGIESGNDHIRNTILGKNVKRQEIIDTARLLRQNGIKIGTFNMVGMPGETFENAWETVRINQIIRSDYPWCSIIQPYPGTELEVFARHMGVLDADYGVDNLNQSYFNNSVIKNPHAKSLVVLQKLFYIAVRFPWLSPLVKRLAENHSDNIITRTIFNLTYAWRYSKTYKMPPLELIKRALLWKDNY